MNLYTQSCNGSYPPLPPTTTTTTPTTTASASKHDHPSPRSRLYDAAMHALEQPHPPSLREILGAYRMKGEGDREMLLAILQAKTAEDQRIAAATKLHQTLLQINFVPPDEFTPGGAPAPLPVHRERLEQPIVHPNPKTNGAPLPAVRLPSFSAPTYNYPHAQAHPTSRRSPEERHPSNGWTTAILSPSSGVESVGEDMTYQNPPSIKGNGSATTHSPTDPDPPPDPEPRGTGGDRVMSIGTLLSSHERPNPSCERRGAAGHGMDVDEEGQARRRRKYDER